MMWRVRLSWRFPARDNRCRADHRRSRRWCGAVPGREVVAVREPGDVSDLGQQPGRPGRSDAVEGPSGWCRSLGFGVSHLAVDFAAIRSRHRCGRSLI